MYYGICEQIGTGTPDDPYRPMVADYGCDYIAIDKQGNGQAGYWIKFVNGDTTGALADNRLDAFPDSQLNDIVGAGQATYLNGKLSTKYGITTNPVVAGMTWLEALEAILAAYEPTAGFDGLKLDGVA